MDPPAPASNRWADLGLILDSGLDQAKLVCVYECVCVCVCGVSGSVFMPDMFRGCVAKERARLEWGGAGSGGLGGFASGVLAGAS